MENRPQTDTSLWDWRYGQTQAERLAADILQAEGFQSIDPQCPLGGPDGGKDILCLRDGKKWVAAVYFPSTRQDFNEVKSKFTDDFVGVKRHQRDGFIFFTNQRLTPGDRAELHETAGVFKAEVYHQERIRTILDSPKGYGMRLEYLRIAMTEEEQHALWSAMKEDITVQLTKQEITILDLHRKMDEMMHRTMQIETDLRSQRSSLSAQRLPTLTRFPTADIQLSDILWIHRLLCDGDMAHANIGKLRNVGVWIGKANSTPDAAHYMPIPPEEVEKGLTNLLESWRDGYVDFGDQSDEERLTEVTSFHHQFLAIHPFLDGNGRVARALLQQQVLEILGKKVGARFTEKPEKYFDALKKADQGNLEPLKYLIKSNLE